MTRAAGDGPGSAADTELSVELLRRDHPEVFSRWVLLGILAGIVGYAGTTAAQLLEVSAAYPLKRSDPWALGICVLALLPWYVGRVRLAGGIVLVTGWIELHSVFMLLPSSAWASSATALPVVILLCALWLGARPATALGVLSLLSVPGAIALGDGLGHNRGLSEPGVVTFIVVLVVTIALTLVLVTIFLTVLRQQLLRSEADERRLRELVDDAPDAILALDARGGIEEANPAAGRLVRLKLPTLRGRPLQQLPIVPTETTWPEALETLYAGGGPVEFVASGGAVLLEGVARQRTRSDGSRGTLLVLRDITARRQAERQAQVLQAQLQRAQKMEAVGILAGSVAHDFNNLLTAVGGYGSLLQSSTDPDVRGYAGEITAMQERGAALVRQLLSFARRDTARARPIDLATMLSGLSPLMQRLLGERVLLTLEVGETAPVVADPGHVEQVMLNLVANARDAMPEGGELRVSCALREGRVVIEVQDSGEGISKKDRERIFEPFFTTKAPGKGTGLGLSTVASIVRDMDGTIDVRSTPPEGTRFVLSLPATELPLEARAQQPTRAELSEGAGRHIVVAEDNDAVRSYLKLLLQRAGFRVTVTRSGDEATDTIAAMGAPPDLLLSDVVMPGRTGPQVAADARVRFPDLPVLFMSGYTGEAGKRGGFDPETDLITKPFTDRELLQRIEAKLAPGLPTAAATG